MVLERERHQSELTQLKELLENAETARNDAIRELESVKSDILASSTSLSTLEQTVESLNTEKSEVS